MLSSPTDIRTMSGIGIVSMIYYDVSSSELKTLVSEEDFNWLAKARMRTEKFVASKNLGNPAASGATDHLRGPTTFNDDLDIFIHTRSEFHTIRAANWNPLEPERV